MFDVSVCFFAGKLLSALARCTPEKWLWECLSPASTCKGGLCLFLPLWKVQVMSLHQWWGSTESCPWHNSLPFPPLPFTPALPGQCTNMLRFLPLKLGRLYRCLKLLFVLGLFVILLMNTHNLFASFQKNELTDRRFINLNKCPACFGTSWCRKFMNGQISFETWGRLRFLDVFNVKNVFFAQYGEPREGTRRIVLKRLGSNQELTDIDQKICKRATGRPRCDLIQAMYKTEFARLNGDVRLLTPDVVEGWSDLVHCPSQRLLDRIVRRYAETKDSGSFLLKNLKDTERMQLLMTLAFNPEPLVLQVGFSCCLLTHLSLTDSLGL